MGLFDDFEDEPTPGWIELSETEDEIRRQDERWGQQDHPDIGGPDPDLQRSLYAFELESIRELEAQQRADGLLGWDMILKEEVLESLSEPDDDKRCEELIQVAAVALQWVAAIRRRQVI